ncbi:hypothetical protein, partial [Streptomyces chiangmaiensis]
RAGHAREAHEVEVSWNADGTVVAAYVGGYNGADSSGLVRGLSRLGEYWSEAASRSRLVAVS